MVVNTPSSSSSSEAGKMQVLYFSNELPNNDLQQLFRRLHNHAKDRKHPVLARFIQEATSAVVEEVRLLPSGVRALVPPFESVLNLADLSDMHKGPLGGAIEGVLHCVAELASLIGYVLVFWELTHHRSILSLHFQVLREQSLRTQPRPYHNMSCGHGRGHIGSGGYLASAHVGGYCDYWGGSSSYRFSYGNTRRGSISKLGAAPPIRLTRPVGLCYNRSFTGRRTGRT